MARSRGLDGRRGFDHVDPAAPAEGALGGQFSGELLLARGVEGEEGFELGSQGGLEFFFVVEHGEVFGDGSGAELAPSGEGDFGRG